VHSWDHLTLLSHLFEITTNSRSRDLYTLYSIWNSCPSSDRTNRTFAPHDDLTGELIESAGNFLLGRRFVYRFPSSVRGGNEQIAVCSDESDALASLVRVVNDAGVWETIPIHWPGDADVLRGAAKTAGAMLLHSAAGPRAELARELAARRRTQPLIVVGGAPGAGVEPIMWLREVPSAGLLAQILHQVLGAARAVSDDVTFRRKSDMIIGDSPAIRGLLHTLDQLATAQTTVLITGESGVGKELVARSLHYCGPRAKKQFVALNCAAIPENLIEAELFGYQRGAFTGAVTARPGAFEAADQGTLFLDEIGEMPVAMQAKLLRVLETTEVTRLGSNERTRTDFRLVAATNRNLENEVKHGRFREDLFYRVCVYPIHVPPLRERLEDLPRLVTHHLSTIGVRNGQPALRLSRGALERLLQHSWPGNVRELVNVLERAALVAESSIIEAETIHFATTTLDGARGATSTLLPYRDAKSRFEQQYYAQLMRAAGGNVTLGAKLGQKTRKEVYDALRRCGLDTMGNPIAKRRRGLTQP
jgi:DNA-binding NtrC family response regulator